MSKRKLMESNSRSITTDQAKPTTRTKRKTMFISRMRDQFQNKRESAERVPHLFPQFGDKVHNPDSLQPTSNGLDVQEHPLMADSLSEHQKTATKEAKSASSTQIPLQVTNVDSCRNYEPPKEDFPSSQVTQTKIDECNNRRKNLVEAEKRVTWDFHARQNPLPLEDVANHIVWKIREHEREVTFGDMASAQIPIGKHDMGGQFLTMKSFIEEESRLFKIAKELPKGAHQHIHFNTELPVRLIVEKASDMEDTIFIRSTQPLVRMPEDYIETEIVFNAMPAYTPETDIFTTAYNPEYKKLGSRPWMKWKEFQKTFSRKSEHDAKFHQKYGGDAKEWIIEKMVLSEKEVYGMTTNGIWARFNQATRCFKGLINYEPMFRWYIGAAIQSMINDKVMYSELRPMLMDKTVANDKGLQELDHRAQMEMIQEEVQKEQEKLCLDDNKLPFGVKIVYCAPRSISKKQMERELDDCIKLKREFPHLICGFDLVGQEDRPNSIWYYLEELLAFQEKCETYGISIPFMFHAGETLLDAGGSRDPENSNLYDAIVLKAKRIGHGFSLLNHPELLKQVKEQDICIEICPTSNELLGLCRNVKEHRYQQLLAHGIPCTLNGDNPSLFRGDAKNSFSLTWEFYQAMVGSPLMSLYGWRQFAETSIDYSCLSEEEKERARRILKDDFMKFHKWIIKEYQTYAAGLNLAEKESL